jgi:hypothetical protein
MFSLDNRYMWNYNLYKLMRSQHVPEHWQIPMIQGFVAEAKLSDTEMAILIMRRRWAMGGTRYNARGIDEEGNVANCVESEQIVIKVSKSENWIKEYTYSHTQIRGSMPFYWKQEGLKAKVGLSRTLESSVNAYLLHFNSLFRDYESDSILMINLLGQQNSSEEILTQGNKTLIDLTQETLQTQSKKIDYEYFDFHQNCKKTTNLLDHFLREILRDLYLRDIGVFSSKHTIYLEEGFV